MWRFLLRQNVNRYRSLLSGEQDQNKRAMLERLLCEAEHELETLESLSTRALEKFDARLALYAQHAVDHAIELTSAQFGILQLFDPEEECLLILAQANFRAGFLEHFAKIYPRDGSISGRAFGSRQRVMVPDIEQDSDFRPHLHAARDGGVRAIQSTPLIDGDGNALGVLSTYFAEPRLLTEEEERRIDEHAQQVAADLRKQLLSWSRAGRTQAEARRRKEQQPQDRSRR